MNDNYLLKGMSSIVNNQNVKSDIDVIELENSMVDDEMLGFNKASNKVEQHFENELEKFANEMGIDFLENQSSPKPPGPQGPPAPPPTNQSEIETRTEDQKKHNHIASVIDEMGGTNWSTEKEQEEDNKSIMLEEIDSLKTSLMEDNVNVERIPTVNQESSYEEISAVHKILRLKNDRMRYCSFAEEFLLFGAHGLEEMFDGKRVWFGHYSPDLTGWHNQVQVKLRRMRHDTSTIVSDVMQDYNIGPGFRILLELVPSLFMYNRLNKQKKLNIEEYKTNSLNDSLDRLRDIKDE